MSLSQPSHYWPLFDLRLATAGLELRPMTEADQPALADALPSDLELGPAATAYDLPDERRRRGVTSLQRYWRAYGTWHPDVWALNFAVRAGGELIGAQELEGNDFRVLRTVDTSSYLVRSARGQGWGREMRAAVLALAFGPLRAEAAITSAWHDNMASLGVSRSLGYRPNGETLHRRGNGADTMVHLRLLRRDWLASGSGDGVAISGFEPCGPLFGL